MAYKKGGGPVRDEERLIREIYRLAGPAENISHVTNCMTRLRLQLVKKDDALTESLKNVDGVLGVNNTESELQIILGPGKAKKAADALQALLKGEDRPAVGDGQALRESLREKNATPAKLFFKRIAGIFIPLIPGFIACGLITGCLGFFLKLFPAMAASVPAKLLAVAGNAVFWGMNLFVGYNAAQVFGGSPILGGVLAALINHPALSGITLLDTPLHPGRGGVIAVILVAAFGAWLERRIRRLVPEMFDLFLTPLFTVLIAGTVALLVLQPIGGALSDAIGAAATWAVDAGGALAGALMAGFWLPMVMSGIHQAVTPIHVDLIAQSGVTILLPTLAMAGAGQVGAALAVYGRTKSQRLRKIIASALPAGILGVGEPLIYGVTFPLGRPFLGACIGGAAGGAVEAAARVGASTLGISGLPLAAATDNIPMYLAGLLAS
ncbi:MAG: PTS transporter subunit EIIC, partial [Schwartzia sp.]|nr:PTS transporter subunit EIIC [Schwartzia sp. (in: firmicutes)]